MNITKWHTIKVTLEDLYTTIHVEFRRSLQDVKVNRKAGVGSDLKLHKIVRKQSNSKHE
jgi:hypothetical protein